MGIIGWELCWDLARTGWKLGGDYVGTWGDGTGQRSRVARTFLVFDHHGA